MSVRGCTVIAVEGTHASGKTTLVHALVAHYRQRGVHVDGTGEPARTSPFIEEIVVHGEGRVRPGHRGRPVRRPTHHPAPDRPPSHPADRGQTIANVVAYARIVLDAQPGQP